MTDEEPTIPESATPAEAQIIAWLAVIKIQLTNSLATAADHERRIRELEARKHISPAAMWSALGGLIALVAASATVIMAIEGAMH